MDERSHTLILLIEALADYDAAHHAGMENSFCGMLCPIGRSSNGCDAETRDECIVIITEHKWDGAS